jgi:hypothetical protein
MMSKSKTKDLDIDFIGGEELTLKEEAELKEYFANKKIKQQKSLLAKNKKSNKRAK